MNYELGVGIMNWECRVGRINIAFPVRKRYIIDVEKLN